MSGDCTACGTSTADCLQLGIWHACCRACDNMDKRTHPWPVLPPSAPKAKKKRTTCRLFHDWSKWDVVRLTIAYKGQQVPADAQIRTCQRCGRTERNIL